MSSDSAPEIYCSFCGKSSDDVTRMVKACDASICNECVVLCVDILLDTKNKLGTSRATKVVGCEFTPQPEG